MQAISTTAGRLAAAFCLMLSVGGTAAAQAAELETFSVKVPLHGIDLNSSAGREQARQHIAYALRRASSTGSVISSPDDAARQEAALAEAMSALQTRLAQAGTPPSFVVATGRARTVPID